MDDTTKLSRPAPQLLTDLPEARQYADWLNAQAEAREAVIEAARELARCTYANSYGRWFTNGTMANALKTALAKLDALQAPADPDDTQRLDPAVVEPTRTVFAAKGWTDAEGWWRVIHVPSRAPVSTYGNCDFDNQKDAERCAELLNQAIGEYWSPGGFWLKPVDELKAIRDTVTEKLRREIAVREASAVVERGNTQRD